MLTADEMNEFVKFFSDKFFLTLWITASFVFSLFLVRWSNVSFLADMQFPEKESRAYCWRNIGF